MAPSKAAFVLASRTAAACAALVLGSGLAFTAAAQTFPNLPITPEQRSTAQQVAQAGVPLSDIQLARDPGYAQLPGGGEQTLFFGERGSGTFPSYALLDLGFNYSVPVFRTLGPWVKLEVLNVTNNQKVIQFNTTVNPDPNSPLDEDFDHATGGFSYFAKTGFGAGASDPAFDDKSWRTLNLPHDWAVALPFAAPAEPPPKETADAAAAQLAEREAELSRVNQKLTELTPRLAERERLRDLDARKSGRIALDRQIEIRREEFVSQVSDIIDKTCPVCAESRKLAGLSPEQIDARLSKPFGRRHAIVAAFPPPRSQFAQDGG